MRILQVFNHYRDRGGESVVVENEAELLRSRGHQVDCLTAHNSDIEQMGILQRMFVGVETIWSLSGYDAMKKAIRKFRPEVIHVHNTFPLLSPSVFWAASDSGVPVVKTLHNYRVTCASAMLSRNGSNCEECVGRSFPLAAVRHRCYRNSFSYTTALAIKSSVHHGFGTYRNKINAYIVFSEFSRSIMMRAGLPANRLFVKPNFTFDHNLSTKHRNQQIVFVGRMMREKGAENLLRAWMQIPRDGHRLLLIGDGPERIRLQNQFAGENSIVWLGSRGHHEVLAHIANSRFLVLPSLGYEGMPMVVLEAFCSGTPVIVPEQEPFPEFVSNGKDAITYSADAPLQGLADALQRAITASVQDWELWAKSARESYRSRFTEASNYVQLMKIYEYAGSKHSDTCNLRLSDRFC